MATQKRFYPGLERKGVIELILLTQVIILLPLFQYLPLWVATICVSVICLRYLIKRLKRPLPGKLLSALIAIAGGGLIYLQFGTFSGRDAGVSLIVLMFSLKLLEMRWYRDAALILLLSFFIMVAHFLYSQSLLMATYMVFCLLIVITALQALNRINGAEALQDLLLASGRMLLQALPLMLILFLFFPRLSEPLWRMPSGASGTTGISDSMTPGDIGSLATFDDPAFRVKFDGEVPASSDLYWRGLVFSDFDGLTWTRTEGVFGRRYTSDYDVDFQGKAYRYELLMEPHRRNWLYALEMPLQMGVAFRTTSEYTWERRFSLTNKLAYKVTSYPEARFGYQLDSDQRQINLQLPENNNPQTVQWALEQRQESASAQEFIQTVLQRINQQDYRYTLNPGTMARNTVDDFWFNKQQGFCEHYAGAFVFIMRAAGIPARVVTGYQGGEMNPYADYMIVRQSDAHAWTEVWLEGRGWTRIDPTAAIHPSRVEVDLSRSWSQREALFNDSAPENWGQYAPGLFQKAQLFWDSVNSYWQNEVIDFSAEQQYEFLARLGLEDFTLRDLVYFLLMICAVVMLLTAAFFLRKWREIDPVADLYQDLQRKLAKQGLMKHPDEGPESYLQRLVSHNPDLAKTVQPAIKLYVQLRYRKVRKQEALFKDFKRQVRAL